jgi:hypothetical protein
LRKYCWGQFEALPSLTCRILKIIAGLFEEASTSKIEGQLIGHVGVRGSTGYFIPAVRKQEGDCEPLINMNDLPKEPNKAEFSSAKWHPWMFIPQAWVALTHAGASTSIDDGL